MHVNVVWRLVNFRWLHGESVPVLPDCASEEQTSLPDGCIVGEALIASVCVTLLRYIELRLYACGTSVDGSAENQRVSLRCRR